MSSLLIAAYLFVLLLLAVYGFHRSHLVYLYLKHRKHRHVPPTTFAQAPFVTIQLPLFNEMYVVERLLDAVAQIDWPWQRLEIQVLDDSTDDTVAIAAAKVAELQARGLDIHYIHRKNRIGFKAGALENGLACAKGEFVLVFDADFIPSRDVLKKTMDHFTDPQVGMVQVRWAHVNRDYSALTDTEALMLDGHFVVEHGARFTSGRFFNFNGTAGIWRRCTIEHAGGWHHETLTEDMDLSYRAQLRGWKFVYLPDVEVPAELPVEMAAFKSQQFRWAKGSIQVAKKLLPTVLRSDAPTKVKIEAFFHLTNNVAYPLMLLVCVLLLPNLIVRTHHGVREVLIIDLPLFFGTTLSIASFYVVSQMALYRDGLRRALRRLPFVIAVGIGLCVNQTRAVIEALVGHKSEFVRTPKHGVVARFEAWTGKQYRGPKSWVPVIEMGLCAYYLGAIVIAVAYGHFATIPFLVLFASGFGYVGVMSIWGDRFSARRVVRVPAVPAFSEKKPAHAEFGVGRVVKSQPLWPMENDSKPLRSAGGLH